MIVLLKALHEYGWTKILYVSNKCNNSIVALNITKIINTIRRISSETGVWSTFYNIILKMNILLEEYSNNRLRFRSIHGECILTIDFDDNIIKFKNCTSIYTFYKYYTVKRLVTVPTFIGNIPVRNLKIISLLLIPLPIISIIISTIPYMRDRRVLKGRYTVKDIFDIYGDNIVEGDLKATLPRNVEVVYVNNFNDLVKISKGLKVPIMHSLEKLGYGKTLHIFYVVYNNKAYLYEITE